MEIENAVARRIPTLFPCLDRPRWTAGSLPVGAGMPDLLVMAYEPEVFALAGTKTPVTHVLAYLRAVGTAALETITDRTGHKRLTVLRCLDELMAARAIESGANVFTVSPIWRKILPDIVTVEAKVTDWKKAVHQAARNRIFAHRSFIALPHQLAERVRCEGVFKTSGVGLLAVNGNNVELLRCGRRREPRVWGYYYRLAEVVAKHFGRNGDAVCHSNRQGEG